jgi:hypothetical protein
VTVTSLRRQQGELLRSVLERLHGRAAPLPSWSLDEHRMAGLATGLTALVAHLTAGEPLESSLRAHLDEQAHQVATRIGRFQALIPEVAATLVHADVPAVFVKGAALLDGVWGIAGARPMADIDLVVPAHLRAVAGAALETAGHRWWASTSYEDAYLAWGDGSEGRRDGESAAHNGRIEVHPGWREHLHGYDAEGFDVIAAAEVGAEGALRLGLAALTAQVLGHLGACVVRNEVRAVNVVDVWWCHRSGVDWEEVGSWLVRADARLTAPAVWLVDRVLPGVVPVALVAAELARLPSSASALLRDASTDVVWRDPTTRTTLAWRSAFARSTVERVRLMDQAVFAGGPRRPATLAARVRR